MTILINGTATTETSTTYLLSCEDQYGRTVNVYVDIIQPEVESLGKCYLTKCLRDGSSVSLQLPGIQSIEEQDTAMLTEISTIIYGFDDNFVMDLGTTQRFTITLKRNTPGIVQDDNDYTHSANWSNGHWYEKFMELTENWQNLNWGYIQNGNTTSYAQTGGFRFHFEPNESQYSNLFPVIDRNVFIAGTVSMSYSGSNLQTMTVSIPLAVSTMVRDQSGPDMREVTYYQDAGSTISFKELFPVGVISIAPNPPKDWISDKRAAMLKYWTSSGVTPSRNYSPGSQVPANVSALVADWIYPWKAYYNDCVSSGSRDDDITVSDNDRSNSSMMAYIIVGHGGRGGIGKRFGATYYGYGGGGGSGGYRTGTLTFSNSMHGNVVKIRLDAANAYTDESVLVVTYEDDFEYRISAENGEKGTNATGSHRNKHRTPGKGGAGGAGGFAGQDATTRAGGAGGDLKEYLDGYQIMLDGETPYGPVFTSSSETDPPTCGAGHNGSKDPENSMQGGKGLIIVTFLPR